MKSNWVLDERDFEIQKERFHMRFPIKENAKLIFFFLLIFVFVFAQNIFAQEAEPTEDEESSSSEAGSGSDDLKKEIDALRVELEKVKEEVKSDKEEQAEKIEALEKELEQKVDEKIFKATSEMETEKTARLLDIYGFFDISFSKVFFEKGSYFGTSVPDKSSFIISNVNLYFDSQMTETLKALLELRFSFLPHGQDESYEIFVGDQQLAGSEYERVSTNVVDPFAAEQFELGGVAIERVHLTYSPFDWFNIMAGRYLTPYGIWNVDHGSPVVLSPMAPIAETHKLIPQAQTGLQIFGKFFASDTTSFDYAITLSNGRNPVESLFDLDENKGVGLHLSMNKEFDRGSFEIGGYGYFGEYTDQKKRIVTTAEGVLDSVELIKTEGYKEGMVAPHILFEIVGLRLQSEYVFKRTHYTYPTPLKEDRALFLPYNPDAVAPDYNQHDVHFLIAYTLPLSKVFGQVKITPFFSFERIYADDYAQHFNLNMYVYGLNIKPSPYVVLKAAGAFVDPDTNDVGKVQYVVGQLAVSF